VCGIPGVFQVCLGSHHCMHVCTLLSILTGTGDHHIVRSCILSNIYPSLTCLQLKCKTRIKICTWQTRQKSAIKTTRLLAVKVLLSRRNCSWTAASFVITNLHRLPTSESRCFFHQRPCRLPTFCSLSTCLPLVPNIQQAPKALACSP